MPCDEYNGLRLIVTPTDNIQDPYFTACDSVLCSMDLCIPLDAVNTCMGPVEESERGLLTLEECHPTVIPPTGEAKAPTTPQKRGRFLVWPVSVSPMPTVGTRS